MNGPKNKRILFAVLNWGLGHATRSIPLIKALSRDNDVILASTGRSLHLLRQEFPDLQFVDFPDYGSHYSKFGFLLIPYLGLQIPVILWRLYKERRRTAILVDMLKLDMIFSDSRFGVYSSKVPSYFMTHQLRFPLPWYLRWMSPASEWYNAFVFHQFTKVFVIDVKEEPNLSKDLSHKGKIAQHEKLVYTGALSSIEPQDRDEDIDLLVSISGPESARTVFENLALRQIESVPGKKVVILGKPGESVHKKNGADLEIYNHVNRDQMATFMNRAKTIVCRSGYSTVMELVALNKQAVLVPTPGQTEQEYLAKYYQKSKLFPVVRQQDLDLNQAVSDANKTNGYHRLDIPVNDIDRFFQHIETPS
mgnify:CR=1 FL=1